ncbi:hypothetical protein [Kitasatospora cheerisanensis]|uniref:hypothetical protein n=1 Tax=Kitasatospora cheerisanensis TaxID=81942 RepID=UPI0012ED9491|nr:hypothetical protein [Kitasatospora cheerisanensis]
MAVAADGTLALTTTGRWSEALRHIDEHRGIGRRILDGRQTAVLARATASDPPGALAQLDDAEPGARWEDAGTALSRPGDRQAAEQAADLWTALEPGDRLAVFTTRLDTTDPGHTRRPTPRQGHRQPNE